MIMILKVRYRFHGKSFIDRKKLYKIIQLARCRNHKPTNVFVTINQQFFKWSSPQWTTFSFKSPFAWMSWLGVCPAPTCGNTRLGFRLERKQSFRDKKLSSCFSYGALLGWCILLVVGRHGQQEHRRLRDGSPEWAKFSKLSVHRRWWGRTPLDLRTPEFERRLEIYGVIFRGMITGLTILKRSLLLTFSAL